MCVCVSVCVCACARTCFMEVRGIMIQYVETRDPVSWGLSIVRLGFLLFYSVLVARAFTS